MYSVINLLFCILNVILIHNVSWKVGVADIYSRHIQSPRDYTRISHGNYFTQHVVNLLLEYEKCDVSQCA